MKYKLIVLDLDGTLTNKDKVITPLTKKALMRAQKEGIRVVLASGRPTYGVMPLAKELEIENYGGFILSYNGGNITDMSSGEVIFRQELDISLYPEIFELKNRFMVDILSYEGEKVITNNASNKYALLEADINHMELVEIGNFEEYVTWSEPKFLFLEDDDYLATVEAKVKAKLGKRLEVYRSEPFFLEILPRGIDKAESLARLLSHLGIEREEIIACGDGYNDLTMIKYAGLGVAMENAVLPVRQAAGFITFSNNDDGIAHVVDKFILNA